MARLFENPEEELVSPDAGARVVGVAVGANVWGTFDYLWPAGLGEPIVGQRVHVPFGRGNRKRPGFVVDPLRRGGKRKLKAVTDLVDAEPQLDEPLWKLGEWMADYYMTPLGMALGAMVPSAVGKFKSRTETVVYGLAAPAEWPTSLGARQRRLLDELHEARKQGVEPLELAALLHHSGASRDTFRRLVQRKLVRSEHRPIRLPELSDEQGVDPFELNEDQRQAMDAFEGKLGAGFSATLLYGVTGSGKTEVYVRAIRQVVAAGGQAIVLVPEIALATQTLQRLLERLPRVAVLHSGLSDSQRAFYYEQIRDGHASVVVGPRSAVFAPARKLGLIVVDEEHESSYKQDTVPRYHGRDVAVKRASLADVPILLGSATPSLESLANARSGRYDLLRLPRRVRGLPMPKLHIVHLRKELTGARGGRIELIGATLTNRMAGALDRGEQIILLMNRRGYASYVFCPSCEWELTCGSCTRAMVFHQATQMVMCHYCQHTASLPERCPACGGKLLLFGMGIQRIEGELARKFPTARVARMDSDTMTSTAQFRKVFDAFSAGELDVLLGTQMVGKGLDFPRVSLVGVVSADTSLAIPDFRASERTFQLVVQVAGRAGRADLPGEVVVQTLHPDEPAIRCAATHDYDTFAEWELGQRAEAALPPSTRVIRLIVRHRDIDRTQEAAGVLGRRLRQILPDEGVDMVGPMPAAIAKIRDHFRFQVLLVARRGGLIQQFVSPRMEWLCKDLHAEVVADVDPVNLV
jgi:primosomal protein N' (replication factor Y) (superfamily II helicase)